MIRYRTWIETVKGEPELRLIPRLANPDKLALDIGANAGVWSFVLAKHASQVHAFEPNPKMLDLLQSWRDPKVIVHAEALSDTDGYFDLLVPKGKRGYSNQGASLSAQKVTGEHRAVKVRTRTLDSFAFKNVGFIKLDVEGHELDVLRGARETLAREKPNLIVEMEERHTGRPLPDMIAEVESYGYRAHFLAAGQLTPFSELDIERQHRRVIAKPGYVFNFIFLP
jgi:FkbM family methyltransferase